MARTPHATTSEDGDLTRIELEHGGVGLLYVPRGLPRVSDKLAKGARRPGLLVVLHGHGGTARHMMQRNLADAHRDYMLSVRGARELQTEHGVGYGWDLRAGTKTINDLVRYVIAHHPVDPDRVVLIGHSAGGTMVLETFVTAPELYVGMITVASPNTPTSAHRDGRLCVFLGTADPNARGAEAVRNAYGGKRRWRNGCLIVLEGAEHNDLPSPSLLALAIDWCLAGRARGVEASLPYDRGLARSPSLPFRVVLVGYKGVLDRMHPRDTRLTKDRARRLAKHLANNVKKGRAFFPLEALAHSEHESFKAGGSVDLDVLRGIDLEVARAAEKLEAGEITGVIATEKGFVIVARETCEVKRDS